MRVFVAAALIVIAGGAAAHEIGTTQVRLTLHRDQTWTALITTAPQTLLNRLEAEAGEPASHDLSGALTTYALLLATRTSRAGNALAARRHCQPIAAVGLFWMVQRIVA